MELLVDHTDGCKEFGLEFGIWPKFWELHVGIVQCHGEIGCRQHQGVGKRGRCDSMGESQEQE